jgi:SP family facilitated glucose transporter-like MFS transporter 8
MICATLPLIFAALFLFMPESPYFLIANGRKNEAIIALKWLRGSSYNILKEIDELSAEIEKHKSERGSLKEELFKKSTIRGIFIAYGLMFFFNMSGVRVVVFYTKDIFEVYHKFPLKFSYFNIKNVNFRQQTPEFQQMFHQFWWEQQK